MSPETRSALMARIKGKDTGPEMLLADALTRYGLRWERHAKDLPGKPDFVFRRERVAVFVDGDFWHGWRFSLWRDKLTIKWEQKISNNRKRDLRIHRALRRSGWRVLRIWEHQIDRDLTTSVLRVLHVVKRSRPKQRARRSGPSDAAPDQV